ncbi:hypothetical protein P3T24_006506 [Paraburkholderia sp. GAS33]
MDMFDKLLRTLPNILCPKGMPLWKPRRRSRQGERRLALIWSRRGPVWQRGGVLEAPLAGHSPCDSLGRSRGAA